MQKSKVLVTCPPMLGMINELKAEMQSRGWEPSCPQVVQTLSESQLIELLPQHHGWIIGDDPVTRSVLQAGKAGLFRAAVKWGIGVDNIDRQAMIDLDIPFSNTPGMFGNEVADLAMSYLTALARETFWIDREVRSGSWPKPGGISLAGKKVVVVGFGDIGQNLAKRCFAADMKVVAVDPAFKEMAGLESVQAEEWPRALKDSHFLVLTCALTPSSRHMVNQESLKVAPSGLRIVNVSRGPVIHETSLVNALQTQHVHSAALDVFEEEPLGESSPLRSFPRCVFGTHNASNTRDAVLKTSHKAIELLASFLK